MGPISINNGAALREKNFAYMLYNDGQEELYDMKNDPKQFTNLSANPEHSPTLKQMRKKLNIRITNAGIKFRKNGKK